MYYLIAIIILFVFVLIANRLSKKKHALTSGIKEVAPIVTSDCCGAHEICEFDPLQFNEEQIVYFDDEELDALRNVRVDELTTKQIEDMREVLYTLQTADIAKWLNSLSSRHIHLPAILQQEARHLMTEKP